MNAKKLVKLIGAIFMVGIGLISFLVLARLIRYVKSAGDSSVAEAAIIYQPAPTPGSDLDSIEADAEIKIPNSAREIHAMISGFRELDTWVRLDLPTEELTEFLSNTQCGTPLTPTDPAKFTRGELYPEWWQPNDAKQLEECSGGHAYLRQRVLVDRTNPDIMTIYVFSVTADFATPTPEP